MMFTWRSTQTVRHTPPIPRPSETGRSRLRRSLIALGVLLGTAGTSLVTAPAAHANAPLNTRPVAQMSVTNPPGPLTAGTPFTLDATGSHDADGDSLPYEWTATSPDVTFHSTQASYVQRFNDPGEYRVSLKVADTLGGNGYADSDVLVTLDNQRPTARFTTSPSTNVSPGTPMTFDASSSFDPDEDPMAYEWWIGDGDDAAVVGTARVLNYTFSTTGVHTVRLVVTDSGGAASELQQQITVPGDPPTAYFTQTPSSPTVTSGTTVTFDGSGSRGTGLTYAWYLGGINNVVGTDPVLEYTFTTNTQIEQPIYILLTVTDVWGQSLSSWTHITVVEPTPPVAIFGQSPSSASVSVGTKVSFDGSTSTGDGLRYAWRVRGETGIVGDNPSLNYTFKKAGSFGIELTVTDSAGRTAKKWTGLQVVAPDPPSASFVRSPFAPTVPVNTKVTFDASASTGEGLTYAWYVRGETGVVSRAKVLNHTFTKAGSYGVELRVTDATGNVAKQWNGLTVAGVNRPPIANFTQSPAASTVKAGTTVTFNGSGSSDPDATDVTYRWYVRGEKGVFNTTSKLTYTFKTAGTYGVELRVTDPSGAVGKKWIAIAVIG